MSAKHFETIHAYQKSFGTRLAFIAVENDQTEGHFHLEFDLPGVKNEDVELVVDDGRLHLKCQRKAPEGERQYRWNHRRYGEYERAITLPDTVDTDKVTAEMRDGVLYLTLTKLPQAQPKRIAVQTG